MKNKRHHYVWRNYLRPWAKNELIWCYREGSFFNPNLMGIGQEKGFYNLKKLSKEHIHFIKLLAVNTSADHLKRLNQEWLDMFDYAYQMQDYFDSKEISDIALVRMLDEKIHNFEEYLHTSIENSSKKFLDSILSENINFFENDDECAEFLHFLCIQYTRTKNMKQNVINATANSTLINIDEIWNVLVHIFATNIGWSLYRDRKQFKLILLSNKAKINFITGDQPIINTFATGKLNREVVTNLEFYYPVSPTSAILLTQENRYIKNVKYELSNKEVEKYNALIVQQSHDQIYAQTKDDLERYAARS